MVKPKGDYILSKKHQTKLRVCNKDKWLKSKFLDCLRAHTCAIGVLFCIFVRSKKDFSTAILERKKAPNKLQVEDSPQDDNSVVELTQAKMDELKIFKGDAVILRGKHTFS